MLVAALVAVLSPAAHAQGAGQLPGRPPSVMVAPAGPGTLWIMWDRPDPATSGPVVEYIATAQPGNHSCSSRILDCTIRGLVDGRPYRITVTARNDTGFGPTASAPSMHRPRPWRYPPSGFADVPVARYYTTAVDWARLYGITDGDGDTNTFGPDLPLQRSQMIALLWRFADSPRGYPAHGFVDVPGVSYYELALRWARATATTTGVGGSRFAPGEVVTRAEVVTFLWRLAGSPTGLPYHGFVDSHPGSYFDEALRWAKARGITTGAGRTGWFDPHAQVRRADAVTMLHRLASHHGAWVSPRHAPSTVLFAR